jgi:hypothetical protein
VNLDDRPCSAKWTDSSGRDVGHQDGRRRLVELFPQFFGQAVQVEDAPIESEEG